LNVYCTMLMIAFCFLIIAQPGNEVYDAMGLVAAGYQAHCIIYLRRRHPLIAGASL
jgi:hypothetical protein